MTALAVIAIVLMLVGAHRTVVVAVDAWHVVSRWRFERRRRSIVRMLSPLTRQETRMRRASRVWP